jgi:ParB-like chromosome segregation protein Spo0J
MLSQATAQRIEQQNNPRKRLNGRLSAIAASIAARAISSPILADAGTVIAGAVRLRAARNSAMDTVPVLELYLGKRHAN